MKLNDNGVQFIKDTHQYFLDGVELPGITGMLSRQLFPDEYKNVTDYDLNRAAERGHIVHEQCELADYLQIGESREAQNYLVLCANYNMKHEASEYLVTDGRRFCSAIDKVYRTGEASFDIADIKTVAKLNRDKVRWQLSIYAYMFELCNPGAKVEHLYALWLRSNDRQDIAQRVELSRIPDEHVEALLATEAAGGKYVNPYDMPESVDEENLAQKLRQLAELQKEVDGLKAGLLEKMQNDGVTKWEGAALKITRKAGSVRKSFDYKKLRKDHAELEEMFAEYDTESTTKESILITLN